MKSFRFLLPFFYLLLLVTVTGCDKDKSSEGSTKGSISGKETGGSEIVPTFSIPQVESNYGMQLFDLQQQIKQAPDSTGLRKKLCDLAYFKNNLAIITVGVGRRTNSATGQMIPAGLVKQAAVSDAARWASYISTWLEQDCQPAFGEISRALNTTSEIITETVIGDSLFVEMAFQY
jgi:hypothetical protein